VYDRQHLSAFGVTGGCKNMDQKVKPACAPSGSDLQFYSSTIEHVEYEQDTLHRYLIRKRSAFDRITLHSEQSRASLSRRSYYLV
jgi:hypothetical protein